MHKTLCLLGICCLLAAPVFAQPVITEATNSPVAGDSFYVYDASRSIGFSAGSAGYGVTWDFSTVPIKLIDSVTYLTCASTAHTDSFSGCQVAVRFWVPDRSDPGYDYYTADSTGFYYQGFYSPASGLGPMVWNKPNLLYYYPLSLGSTADDTCISYTRHSEIITHYECDGYGTLKLPGTTHTNVLRLHRTNLDCPRCIYQGRETYIWLKPGLHHELVSANFDTSGGTLHMIRGLVYSTSELPVGLPSQPKIANKIYPNPAKDQLNIELTTLEPCDYSVLTPTGTILDHREGLTGKITVDISTLSPGLYYVKLHSISENEVVKFVKE